MRHPGRLVALAVLACGGVAVVPVLSMLGAMMGAAPDGSGGCSTDAAGGPVGRPVSLPAGEAGGLGPGQLANAATVVREGRRLGVPSQGIVVALAAASQESRFRTYANDGLGSDITVLQSGVRASLRLPHDAVGSDHGSVGIFQQQWPWWGTLGQLMDPATSADRFYKALVKVPGWQGMPVTVAAQRVQRSAFPDAYADDEALARRLLGAAHGAADAGGSGSVQAAAFSSGSEALAAGCAGAAEPVAVGSVVFPLPRSASFVDQRNYGGNGDHWARFHTGTDLSASCGTPVLAVTAGTVIVRTDQAWAGRWLVQVSTGTGQLTTWYAHMRALMVRAGDQVAAGEPIGQVGDLGNATGCHLHLEVHPRGGSIYQDSVDPTPWLAQHVGRDVGSGAGGSVQPVSASPSSAGPSSGSDWFTVATFNTLGDSHTAAGGSKPWMASGRARMAGAVATLARYGVDVVGFQELQRPQYDAFRVRTGGAYGIWSTAGDTENAVAWRRSRFRLVATGTVSVPYFDGHHRRMPVVRLQDLTTGRTTTFVNVHNPADTGRYPHQGHWRSLAMGTETSLVHRLTAGGGGPVVVTGDMNDRHDVYCRFTAGGLMASARPGSPGAGCHPPAHPEIDWIFGTRSVAFSDYTRDRGPLVRRTTDHPLVVARAHVG